MRAIPAEIAPGLWRWTSTQGAIDEGDLRRTSHHHAFACGDALVVVDPVGFSASTPELDALYAQAETGRALHVVMTDPTSKWHTGERICREHGGTIWGSADTARLLDDPSLLCVLESGAPGPGGVVAYDVGGPTSPDRAIWVPAHRTLAFGPAVYRSPADGPLHLAGWPNEPRAQAWFQDTVVPSFAPLLDLSIERLALRHGDAVTERPLEALLEALTRAPGGS